MSQLNDFRTEVERLRLENDDLKSQITPKVDNIATIEDVFQIRYTYQDDGRYKSNGIFIKSWAELFKIIGPSFFSPHGNNTIEFCLKREIRHEMGDRPLRGLHIFDGDIETMKIQMVAYGFMKGSSRCPKRLKAAENWKPGPVSDFVRNPYMLMNLGQRDEPSS